MHTKKNFVTAHGSTDQKCNVIQLFFKLIQNVSTPNHHQESLHTHISYQTVTYLNNHVKEYTECPIILETQDKFMFSDENVVQMKRQTAAIIRETTLYWCVYQRYTVSLVLCCCAALRKTAEQVHSILKAQSHRHLLYML